MGWRKGKDKKKKVVEEKRRIKKKEGLRKREAIEEKGNEGRMKELRNLISR